MLSIHFLCQFLSIYWFEVDAYIFFSVPVSSLQTIQNWFLYLYISSLSFCIYLVFCVWYIFPFTSQLTLSCSFAGIWCCDLWCYCVCAISVISVHWPNTASALSCSHCALTWFKFKLAHMSIANQMLCMIIYGWVLSEIQGCCWPVTGLCSHGFTLILA